MVSISALGSAHVVSPQTVKLLDDVASSAEAVRRTTSGLGFRSAESTVASAAIAKIQELIKGTGLSPEQEAMARVKGWVASGLAREAAAGRDDQWLKQMAAEHKLGNLPALTREQESSLSTAELRVYVEARYQQAIYSGPQSISEVQATYAQQMIPSYERSIASETERLRAGGLPDYVMKNIQQTIVESKAKLAALRAGNVSYIQADESFVDRSQDYGFVRDGRGLVIGGRGGIALDSMGMEQKYVKPGQLWETGFSANFGAYMVVFDVDQ